MPRRIPVTFGLDVSPAQHRGAAYRSCINLRTQPLPEGSKSPLAAYRMEGLDGVTSPTSTEIRGMRTMRGSLYFVAGTNLYKFTAPNTLANWSGITGTGRVSMAGNGDELVIVNSAGTAFRFNGSAVSTISDPDLPAVGWVESFDQYIVYGRLDGEGWGVSDLADATAYDPLDVASAESDPDPIVYGIRNLREMHLMGKDTIESFYVVGGGGFPFERAPDGVVEVGLAAKWSVGKIDNRVVFLGNEKGGLSVRMLEGRTPVRISTPEIDDLLDNAARTNSSWIAEAFAFTYAYAGHAYYVLTVAGLNLTLQYDCLSRKWQQRESSPGQAWRVGFSASAYNQIWFGETATGRIMVPNRGVHTELGNALHWETVCAPAYFQGRMLTFAAFELILDRTFPELPRAVSLSWSDDDGTTWSSDRTATTSSYVKGRPRLRWTNLGSSTSRLFRLKGSSPQPMALIEAFADVEVGG